VVPEDSAVDERETQVASGPTAALSAYIDLSMDDVVSFFTDPGADAVLAASIFHYGTYRIRACKEYMAVHGLPVRP